MSGLSRIFDKSDSDLAAELKGFPERALALTIQFRDAPSPELLADAALAVLEFYLPRQHRRSLAGVLDSERLREELGVDSLALAEATFKLEELFGFPVETRELTDMNSVGDLRHYLNGKFNALRPA
ncbi:MAG: acyl carrier protein [Verrucomicrobiales bacterium]|nr:acyl carrier protein [Verrucomicrobiales bacterium]